jgi:hypothetical protein
MATTRYTGKNLVVEWKKTGSPTAVVLTADGRAFEFTHEMNTADGTAGADEYEVSLPTIKRAEATMEMLMNSTAAWEAELKVGDTGALMWYPEGKVVGKPEWGMDALVTNKSPSLPYNDVSKYSLAFKNYGSTLLAEGEDYVSP